MKVKSIQSVGYNGQDYLPGCVFEMDKDEATRLLKEGVIALVNESSEKKMAKKEDLEPLEDISEIQESPEEGFIPAVEEEDPKTSAFKKKKSISKNRR